MKDESYDNFFTIIIMISSLIFTLFIVYLISKPTTHSDKKQAEIDQQTLTAEQERKQRRSIESIAEGVELANDIVYVQDTRTGICFATEGVQGWHGHFTTVDCDMIPVEMLHTNKRKVQ